MMHAPMMRALLLPLLLAGATPPPIEWAAKGDNVYARAAWKHDNPANHVVYLGTLASADACAAACVRRGPQCRSFTFNGFDDSTPSFTSQCFMVTDGWWHPFPDVNTTSGRVSWCPTFKAKSTCPATFCRWSGSACVEPPPAPPPPPPPVPPPPCSPCKDDAGCSYNGKCSAGACTCDVAWQGGCCEVLAFAPAVRGAGLHTVEADGRNTSSWGGSVLRDEKTGIYHMWAAEMTRHW
jgi:hypothetical protein